MEETFHDISNASTSKTMPPPAPAKSKTSIRMKLSSLWRRTGLKSRQLKTMFKGAWPPVIALALYQYDPFSDTLPTLGYLAAIVSVLSMAFLPRARFIEGMLFSMLGTGMAICVALLTCYCAVQARLNTSVSTISPTLGASGTHQAVQYNSSASAVSAVFLFLNIMIANALRAARPQFLTPTIIYCIFANISGTFAPDFGSMAQVYSLIKQMAIAFCTGYAIAIVCHFVIFPTSSRDLVLGDIHAYLGLLQKLLSAEQDYLQSMESPDMLHDTVDHDGNKTSRFKMASVKLKGSIASLSGLHGKIQTSLPYVKRESAYSHMSGKDISNVFANLRQVYLPLLGLSSVADIFERIVVGRSWGTPIDGTTNQSAVNEVAQWNEIMQTLHDPFDHVTKGISEGLQHVTYRFGFEKPPRPKKTDVEKDPSIVQPGDDGYLHHLEEVSAEFWNRRSEALKVWCIQKNIPFLDFVPEKSDPSATQLARMRSSDYSRQQLYLILYMDFLLHSAAKAVIDLVRDADRHYENSITRGRYFVFPGRRRLKKWFQSVFKVDDSNTEHATNSFDDGACTVSLGDAFKKRKDPEHLPPTNTFQRIGQAIRKIVSVLRSEEMAFGFRVACATMSVAIIGFLESTQAFFLQQRIVWAMIMVAISMSMTSGSGVFGFAARIFGTLVAMCSSIAIWYIAGGAGNPVGVLILVWFAMFIILYFLLNYPRYIPVCMITMVTHCLILGYELQVNKVGIEVSTSSGQVYYPIYLMGPYRLATVTGGLAVAFIWTYFPYPFTSGNTLRRQLGQTLYLLSNYYSVVHYSINARLNSTGGNPEDKKSHHALLNKARNKLLGKLLALQTQLRTHLSFVPLDFSFGGKFPIDEYTALVGSMNSLRDYITLLSYATRDYMHDVYSVDGKWLQDLNKISSQTGPAAHEITRLLILLSSSLLDSQPLPPYLSTPTSFRLVDMLSEIDPEILGAKHFLEPGYASFAVAQVAGKLINDDLCNILRHVKNLVGEIDFSFHVISTTNSSQTILPDSDDKGKMD